MVAKNTWAAMKAREALKITWDDGPNADYDSVAFRGELEKAARAPGKVVRDQGDVAGAMAKAKTKLEAEYFVPHLVQAPMEPPAATVRIKDGFCEAWACTQAPQATHDRLAKKLNLPADKVRVNVTLLGGGFGRKSKPDYVLEAALCSQAVDGAPVKLIWTREDDLHHGYYHTISVERLEAGLDDKGMPVAWLHRSAAPTIGSIFAPDPKHELPFELGMGLTNTPFAVPNIRLENPAADAHVRIGWFRSVSNIPHAFAIQSFVAELAHAAGKDPKEYLLALIGPDRLIDPTSISDVWNYGEDPARYPIDTGRLRRVIEAAAKGIGWGRKMAKGTGLGIAGHYSFVTHTAVAAEVAVGPKGEVAGQARRHRHRLRTAGQPGADPLADGGRGRHGHGPRALGRDHLQGRTRAAEQLRRLRDHPHRRGAEGDPRPPAAEPGLQPSARRRRRARRAARGAGDRQRDLRRHRPAHPAAADPRSAERLIRHRPPGSREGSGRRTVSCRPAPRFISGPIGSGRPSAGQRPTGLEGVRPPARVRADPVSRGEPVFPADGFHDPRREPCLAPVG